MRSCGAGCTGEVEAGERRRKNERGRVIAPSSFDAEVIKENLAVCARKVNCPNG
jgi:ribosomal protein S6E (S10)